MFETSRHTATKLAVGYVRCSTELQEDSPDQQRKAISEHAAKLGLTITEWFIDFGKSGTTFNLRPEFQRLMKTVESGPDFSFVICYDESRWGRAIDPEENTYYRQLFKLRGVEITLVKTSVDPKSEFAPMLKALEGIEASRFSKKLSELTLRGMKSNDRYSSGGTPPYGYCRVAVNLKTDARRRLAPGEWCVKGQEKVVWDLGDPVEVEIVRFIYSERSKGSSFLGIAAMLNERSIPCPKRGRWRNKDQKWSAGTIRSILENPAYTGSRVFNRISSSRIVAVQHGLDPKQHASYPMWRNDPTQWVIAEEAHPSIVTKEEWESVNNAEGRARRESEKKMRVHSPYLLTGLMRCSECGFAFQGWSGQANGKLYQRYIDGGWKSKRVCSHLSIPKKEVEEAAIKAVKETLADMRMISKIEEALRNLMECGDDIEKAEQGMVEDDLKAVERKIENLVHALETGMKFDSVHERLAKLESERSALKQRLAEIALPKVRERTIRDYAAIVARFIEDFERNFDKVSLIQQKEFLRRCIEEVVVDRQEKNVRFYVRRLPTVEGALGQPNGGRRPTDGEFVTSKSAQNRS